MSKGPVQDDFGSQDSGLFRVSSLKLHTQPGKVVKSVKGNSKKADILFNDSNLLSSPTQPSVDSHVSSTHVPSTPGGQDSLYCGSDTIHSHQSIHGDFCLTPGDSSRKVQALRFIPGSQSVKGHRDQESKAGSHRSKMPEMATSKSTLTERSSNSGSTARTLGPMARTVTVSPAISGRSQKDDIQILAWHELEPISVTFSTQYWANLLAKLDPASEDWNSQVSALTEVRRISVFHNTAWSGTVPHTARRPAGSSTTVPLHQLVLQRVIALADSLRSAVSRGAIMALNDAYLFAAEEVDGPVLSDALLLCLKRAGGPGNAFISEEAERCCRQIVLVADINRIVSALSICLTRIVKTNATLKAKCINAFTFLSLRATSSGLRAITQHKDFVPVIFKTICKAASDASRECRLAAGRCIFIITNLIPDLFKRFRAALSEAEMTQVATRMKKIEPFDVARFYGISQLQNSLETLPPSFPADLALNNLGVMMDNLDLMAKHPVSMMVTLKAGEGTKASDGGSALSRRSYTPGKVNSSPSPRSLACSPPTRPCMSTVSGVSSQFVNGLIQQRNHGIIPKGGSWKVNQSDDARTALFEDVGEEDEDKPWSPPNGGVHESLSGNTGQCRSSSVIPSREATSRTPIRARGMLDVGPGRALTPTSSLASSTVPRVRQRDSETGSGYGPAVVQRRPPALMAAGRSASTTLRASKPEMIGPNERSMSLLKKRW